jgi:hypothetical protein
MPSASTKRRRWTRYIYRNGYNLGLMIAVAWVANYLHFTDFGLYEDDWFFVGFPFVVDLKTWMVQSLWQQLTVSSQSVGRPLQMVFNYVFAEVGAAANSLAVDYVVAFILFAGCALLIYEIVRRRFSRLVAVLAALLFVLTPLHTLHQFLNGQFSVGPAFCIVFLAMLLYLKGHRTWSYPLAFLAVLSYESIFFLFLGTPLLKRGKLFRGRGREWIIHLSAFIAIVILAFVIRKASGESRVEGLPHGLALLWPVIHWWGFYSLGSFATYLYAALRVHEASFEACVYAAVFFVAIVVLFYRQRRLLSLRNHVAGGIARSVGIALLFLVLGYVLSYFFFLQPTPHLSVTDRETRISFAASFGSSLLLAVLLAGWIRSCNARATRLVAYLFTSTFLTVLFLYSFVIQDDYVKDWQQQREDCRQMIALTPDVQRDSVIVLKLAVGGDGFFLNGPRRRGNGLEKTLYERMFGSIFAPNQPWPQLFVVYSDQWVNYLKQSPDGYMDWTQKSFHGRWYPAVGRFLPERFIVLEEKEPGWVIRKVQPIFVNGVQIVQIPPLKAPSSSLWATVPPTRLERQFLSRSALQFAAHPASFGLPSKPFLIATAKVQFPQDAPKTTGLLDPLVTTGVPGAGDLISVRYAGGNRLSFRIDHWGNPGVEGGEMSIDPNRVYSLEVAEGESGTSLRVNGNQVVAFPVRAFATARAQVTFGTNRIGGGITGPKFSGNVLSTKLWPMPVAIAKANIRFPENAPKSTGLLEPLIVTGATRAGDLVSVRYLGHNRVMFRIDHWGLPGVEGGALTINPKAIYSLEVDEDRNGTSLSVNGEEKLFLQEEPYVTSRGQVTFGENKIGGGTAGPKFSGRILSSDLILHDNPQY